MAHPYSVDPEQEHALFDGSQHNHLQPNDESHTHADSPSPQNTADDANATLGLATASLPPMTPVEKSVLEEASNAYVQAFKDDAQGRYAPRLISNNAGQTFGDILKGEFKECDGFTISVAFITQSIVKSLMEDIKGFSERTTGADHPASQPAGRIITSTKSYFNDPKMFLELRKLQRKNGLDVRIWDGKDHSDRSTPPSPGTEVTPINPYDADETAADEAQDPQGMAYNFHPKGYIFRHHTPDGERLETIYIGSSNMTDSALRSQREWNLRVSATPRGSIAEEIDAEVARQINESTPLTDEWIAQYEKEFTEHNIRQRLERELEKSRKHGPIVPNAMQREALAHLAELRDKGETRAIVIAATGTGKTILSALDVRTFKPRRMLYLVHQDQILKSAINSFQRVLPNERKDDFGLVSSSVSDDQSDRKYVFSTVQSMQKDDRLHSFAPDDFDYILIDEVHHAAAASYKKIIDYFHPRFLLGMTATPERTDGESVFDLFGNNVAYEIRLQDALEAQLLAPFHYYGVAEYLTKDDDRIIVDGAKNPQIHYGLSQLISEGRVRYIIDKLDYYKQEGAPVKGLVFCSRVDEARALSEEFNKYFNQQAERTFRTVEVDGSTPKSQVQKAIDKLENGEIDYIFTIDLFNEGIDIPSVNQIVMLRNTESSIVFTQQLGRGLRKMPLKDFVTIVDFVGNYAKSYLIPMALTGHGGATRNGNTTHPKVPALCSASFDRITEKRIAETIKHADLSDMRRLNEMYTDLRNRLNKVPTLLDIFDNDWTMVRLFATKSKCYYSFAKSREDSLKAKHPVRGSDMQPLTGAQLGILRFISDCALNGLRPHELLALAALGNVDLNYVSAHLNATDLSALLMSGGTIAPSQLATCAATNFPKYQKSFADGYGDSLSTPQCALSALRILDGEYCLKGTRERYNNAFPLVRTDAGWQLSEPMKAAIRDPQFKHAFDDSVRAGLALYKRQAEDAHRQGLGIDNGFVVGWQYSRAEVMRLLNFTDEVNPQNVGGYICNRDINVMPIFIKYAASQYDDRFLNAQDIRYFSKDKRHLDSPEFLWARDDSHPHFIPVFIRRKEREEIESGREPRNKNYSYVGNAAGFFDMQQMTHPSATDPGKQIDVVVSRLHLRKPVPMELLQDLTGETFL